MNPAKALSTLERVYWYSNQETSQQRHRIYIYGRSLATISFEVSNKKNHKPLNISSPFITKAISCNIENDQSTEKSSGNYTARYWDFRVCLSDHHSSYSFIFLIKHPTLNWMCKYVSIMAAYYSKYFKLKTFKINRKQLSSNCCKLN